VVAALRELTTMRVGGEPERLVTATTQRDLVDAALSVWGSGEDWLVLGGGSNLVVSDDGYEGTVIRVATKGIELLPDAAAGRALLRVQAGENWDDLVAYTVAHGWSGLEALSGIPGLAGAAPMQNIGAYGQEVASVLRAIDFLDYDTHQVTRVSAEELELGYRTSALKQGRQGVVIALEIELHDTAEERRVLGEALGRPIEYAQLASTLGVQIGDRVATQAVRDAVLALRASKGMVLNPEDHDTWSAGSFFTNPIVREGFARGLPAEAPQWPVTPDAPDVVEPLDRPALDPWNAAQQALAEPAAPEPEPRLVKLSAAWLIENAGIRRGFALPGSNAAVSSKHTLALTNRGGASAAEVAQLARFVQSRVQAEFGIILQPEPVVVGLEL
jgi:UDP-N-acetylmuramate dehydrogenase